jgi:DNA-binding MarR family transcriptional regulator
MTRANAVLENRPAESAFRSLIRTIGLIDRVMHPYFARYGISRSQWSVLRALHRSATSGVAGLRLTDLSEQLLIRPPSVTGVIDRLERIGLVAREQMPDDLRARRVCLTPRGRQMVNRVLQAHSEQIDSVMGALTSNQQRELNGLLSRLGTHLEGLSETQDAQAEAPAATVA